MALVLRPTPPHQPSEVLSPLLYAINAPDGQRSGVCSAHGERLSKLLLDLLKLI